MRRSFRPRFHVAQAPKRLHFGSFQGSNIVQRPGDRRRPDRDVSTFVTRIILMTSNVRETPTDDPERPFRIIAIIAAYNEEDIIADVVADLIRQGVIVYFLDHWSTDGTA